MIGLRGVLSGNGHKWAPFKNPSRSAALRTFQAWGVVYNVREAANCLATSSRLPSARTSSPGQRIKRKPRPARHPPKVETRFAARIVPVPRDIGGALYLQPAENDTTRCRAPASIANSKGCDQISA
jgi:hypothetical protein